MPEEEESVSERLDRIEDLLEEQAKLAKETHRTVKRMQHVGRLAFWFKVILWTVVLVLPFFFLGPITRYFTALTGFAVPTGANLFGVPSEQQIQQAVQQFKAKNGQAQ